MRATILRVSRPHASRLRDKPQVTQSKSAGPSGAAAVDAVAAPQVAKGVIFGLAAVIMWALYFIFARRAAVAGLLPQDVAVLRYAAAGAILLPWVLARGLRDLGGVGWARGCALAAMVGPLFIALGAGGFLYAPLAHGAVIQPATAALVASVIAVIFLREGLDVSRMLGLAMVICGIGIIGALGAAAEVGTLVAEARYGTEVLRGQIMFVGAGALWAAFTIALRQWQVPAVGAAAAVSVISALVILPVFATFDSFARLAALPWTQLVLQVTVHGVMAGVLAMVAYARSVALLGVGRAALFPAIVPAAALLLGVPITGEVPLVAEIIGAALATCGLIIAMHGVPGLRRAGVS